MFSENMIRNLIKQKIDEGTREFVIYPFGINGMRVKKILEEYFQLAPMLIVDNEYYKYNTNICNFEHLKSQYQKDIVVILTVEDSTLNEQMERELLGFVAENKIINCLSYGKKEKEYKEEKVIDQFSLEQFIPVLQEKNSDFEQRGNGQKIKIRFFHHQYNFWNNIKTICSAFRQDDKYDILIILRENEPELLKKHMTDEGYSYVVLSEYDVKEDCPDIMILYHGNENTVIKNCRKYTKMIVVVPLMLMRYSYTLEGFWKHMERMYGVYEPDYYLFDTLLYNEIRKSKYYCDKIIEMGNAKFDGIYFMINSKREYPDKWEKLAGKKTVLWTTDHGVGQTISDYITFDLYAKAIFEYANKHPEMGFIMRLHQTFVRELLENGYWNQKDVELLREYCENTSNFVWDESVSYDAAYSIADGILTDALCGITVSALPTMKPICVMYRNCRIQSFHPEIAECYYSAYSQEELINFFIMISNGEDEMKHLRAEANRRYIQHFDGHNGERIKEFVDCKFMQKFGEDRKYE